jgi:hypothetical protein
MGKHEIRLRRQRMTASGADRFRNYRAVLERHEQDQKMKKIFRFFTYFLALVVIVLLIFFLNRWEKSSGTTPPPTEMEKPMR